jgi:hypothetical protein
MYRQEKLLAEKLVGKKKVRVEFDHWSLHRLFGYLGSELHIPNRAVQEVWEQFQVFSESEEFLKVNTRTLQPVLRSLNEQVIIAASKKFIALSALKSLKSSYFQSLSIQKRVFDLYKPIFQCLIFFLFISNAIHNFTFQTKEAEKFFHNDLVQMVLVFTMKYLTDSIYTQRAVLSAIKKEPNIIKIEVIDLPLE